MSVDGAGATLTGVGNVLGDGGGGDSGDGGIGLNIPDEGEYVASPLPVSTAGTGCVTVEPTGDVSVYVGTVLIETGCACTGGRNGVSPKKIMS